MVQVILGSAYISKCTIVIVNNSSNNIIQTIKFPSYSAALVELKRMAIKPLKKETRKQKIYWRSLIVQC
jgi:hypothetical protein